MLDRTRRAGPLAVDALPAFVEEQGGVTRPRMQLGEGVADDQPGRRVYQGPAPIRSRAFVSRIAVGGIPSTSGRPARYERVALSRRPAVDTSHRLRQGLPDRPWRCFTGNEEAHRWA